jgi:hypothetical protein
MVGITMNETLLLENKTAAKAKKQRITVTGMKYDIDHAAHDLKKIKVDGKSDVLYYGGD